jgi:hypothetical protein
MNRQFTLRLQIYRLQACVSRQLLRSKQRGTVDHGKSWRQSYSVDLCSVLCTCSWFHCLKELLVRELNGRSAASCSSEHSASTAHEKSHRFRAPSSCRVNLFLCAHDKPHLFRYALPLPRTVVCATSAWAGTCFKAEKLVLIDDENRCSLLILC